MTISRLADTPALTTDLPSGDVGIDLDRSPVRSGRRVYRPLAAVAFVLVGLAAGLLLRLPTTARTAAAPVAARPSHRVEFDVSSWPASGAAGWSDGAGHEYVVPLGTFSIAGPVEHVWMTVDEPGAQCTIIVDGVVAETAAAAPNAPATCSWDGPTPADR